GLVTTPRRAVRRGVGWSRGRFRRRAPAALVPALPRVLHDRSGRSVHRGHAQPARARVPARRGARVRRRAAATAARLRRVRARGDLAAALLSGRAAAADVDPPLPDRAVPAQHLAGGVARRAPARAPAVVRAVRARDGVLRGPVLPLALGGVAMAEPA